LSYLPSRAVSLAEKCLRLGYGRVGTQLAYDGASVPSQTKMGQSSALPSEIAKIRLVLSEFPQAIITTK